MPRQWSQTEMDFGSSGGRKLVGVFDGGAASMAAEVVSNGAQLGIDGGGNVVSSVVSSLGDIG